MRITLKYILVLGFVLFMTQGCNDLLDDPTPSDELSQSVVLSDPGSVNSVRIDMYDRIQSFNYTTLYMLGPSAIADDFVNLVGTSRFEGLTGNQVGAGLGRYGTTYGLINQANLIIGGVDEATANEISDFETYQGEAYFFRAFAMHNAVRAYGYEPGATPTAGEGSGFDLGIIVRTNPTLGVTDADLKTRSTVSAVYDQIEDDLNQAISLLDNSGSVNFVSQAAASALMARVKLYRRSYGDADSFAGDAITNSGARMATTSEVSTMFDETTGANPEAIFISDVDPTTGVVGGSDNLNGYTAGFWNAMIPSKGVLNMYSANDARGSAWFGDCQSTNKGDCTGDYPGDPNFDAQELQKWNAEQGSQTDDIPHFRVAELKLIQAEARAMDANAVTQGAVDALNDVRTNRGLAGVSIADYATSGVDGFIDDVLEERQREFIGEGHRFYDLKRLQRDIPKPPVTTFAPELPFSSFRVLDDIPPAQIDINPELTQNPGY
jgi:hypothetical protein